MWVISVLSSDRPQAHGGQDPVVSSRSARIGSGAGNQAPVVREADQAVVRQTVASASLPCGGAGLLPPGDGHVSSRTDKGHVGKQG